MALTVPVSEIVNNSKNPILGKHESWGRVLLGDVASIQNGYAFKSSQFVKDKGVPLIRIRDVGKDRTETNYIGEYDLQYLVTTGDLLIGMDGDFNCARWKGSDGLLNQRVCRVTLKSDIYHPKLLDYTLPAYLKAINEMTSSVTVKHLSSKTVSQIPLPLPPMEQQQRIVAEIEKQFSRLDEAAANLKRAKANLKPYKTAVLKAAVEGKLTEEWRKAHPDVEQADKILERILTERRKNWEETELAKMKAKGKEPKDDKWKSKYKEPIKPSLSDYPDLPYRWTWATVEQLASDEPRSIQSGPFGSNLKHSEFQETGKLVIGIDNVKDGYFSIGTENRISNDKFRELEKYSARPEDVLITVMATIGRTCVIPKNIEPSIITKHVYRISTDKDLVSPYFLHLALWGGAFVREQMFGQVIGQTRPGLNGKIIKRLVIPLPSIEEQNLIIDFVKQKLSIIDKIFPEVDKSEKRTERLRQSILSRAFSGQLVPQEPSDESVEKLLDRIKNQEVVRLNTIRSEKPKKVGGKMTTKKIKRSLLDIIEENPDGITPEALLSSANYTFEEVDLFYFQLSKIFDRIEQIKPTGNDALDWPHNSQVVLKLKAS